MHSSFFQLIWVLKPSGTSGWRRDGVVVMVIGAGGGASDVSCCTEPVKSQRQSLERANKHIECIYLHILKDGRH